MPSTSKPPKPFILTVGMPKEVLDWLQSELKTIEFKSIVTADDFEALLDIEDTSGYMNFVFTGPHVQQVNGDELAQGIRLAFPQCRLIMISTSRAELEVNTLKKNGASEVYLFPGDQGMLSHELDKIVASLGKDPGLVRYRPVQLMDIAPGDTLPFDMSVFLPLNNKYVKVVKEGAEVRETQYNKMKEKSVGQVYIDSVDMEKFYDYSAEKLAEMADQNSGIPETERLAQIQSTTRDLFTAIFDTSENADFSVGQQFMEQSQKVVEKYMERKLGGSVHEQLQALMGKSNDTYSHASNVSALACLLSMATQIGNPDELALAGLFHDMALVDFPIPDHNPSQEFLDSLDEENKKIYMEHPLNAVRALKSKRMSVTEPVAKMIEQHHERVDGKGFPKQLVAAKISQEAQLLAIADQIDYMAQRKASQKSYSLKEALDYLTESGAYSFEVLSKIKKTTLAES